MLLSTSPTPSSAWPRRKTILFLGVGFFFCFKSLERADPELLSQFITSCSALVEALALQAAFNGSSHHCLQVFHAFSSPRQRTDVLGCACSWCRFRAALPATINLCETRERGKSCRCAGTRAGLASSATSPSSGGFSQPSSQPDRRWCLPPATRGWELEEGRDGWDIGN